jgi:ribosomal protein L22
MGKKKHERTLSDTEAKAISRNLRVSPQKLNLLAQLIRGKKVSAALADLEFSRKPMRKTTTISTSTISSSCRPMSARDW